MHIFMLEFILCIVVSNYVRPNEFGDHLVLDFVLGTWRYFGACLNNKDEVVIK
jgi:hypothetical protein